MAKAEEKREITPESLKEKAIELIEEQYKVAAYYKAHHYSYIDDPELGAALDAEVMQRFAVNLGIMTAEEAEKLKKEYWDNRDKIVTDIPDRFGD